MVEERRSRVTKPRRPGYCSVVEVRAERASKPRQIRSPQIPFHASRLSVPAGRIEHMIETLAAPGAEVDDDLSAAGLLASITSRKAAEDRAAADVLDLAARWADLHPPESIHSAAAFTVPGFEHEEPIAGPGCPLVAEFCVAELGTVLGTSTSSAKSLIGHALELRHRLPRLWTLVQSGTGSCVAGEAGRRGHHPRHPRPHRRGRRFRGRAGRCRRRSDRSHAARPPRCRDHQALRPRHP